MSPHNTRYKDKPESAGSPKRSVVSKHSPPTPRSKSKSKTKSPPRSMSSSPSYSVSSSSSTRASGALSKPKRPLSAYNLFFKHTRDEMLASTASAGSTAYDHSKHATTLQSPSARRDLSKRGRPPPHRKIGFAEMARQIGAQWKALEGDRREHFESLARVDKQRYLQEMEAWKAAGGDKQLPPKDKKSATGEKGASSSKSTGTRKSPPSSPKSKKSKKKAKAGAPDVAKSTADAVTPSSTPKETDHYEMYSHGDYLTYHIGVSSSSRKQQTPTFDGNHARVSNIPRTVSARSSIANGSTESLHDYTDGGTSLTNYYHNGVTEPYTHHYHGHPQQMQQRMAYHADFQPPPASTARRVSEGNDGDFRDDFFSETAMDSSHTYYHGQQHSSYVTHHDQWQYQSTQPPHYSYQQVAPGDVAPSSVQRRHQISYDDFRNVPVSSAISDSRANKITPSNWNTTMGGYPVATDPVDSSHQSQKVWQSTETASSSSSSDETAHNNDDPKWSEFDDTDRLLDVLGKIDDDDWKVLGD